MARYVTQHDFERFTKEFCEYAESGAPLHVFPGACWQTICNFLESDKLTDEQKDRCHAAKRAGVYKIWKRFDRYVNEGGVSQAQMTGAIYACKNKGLLDNITDKTTKIELVGSARDKINQLIDARARGEIESRQYNDLMKLQQANEIDELREQINNQNKLLQQLLESKLTQ